MKAKITKSVKNGEMEVRYEIEIESEIVTHEDVKSVYNLLSEKLTNSETDSVKK